MGKIKDTGKYPYDTSITKEDYLIGTDEDSNGRTKNYRVGDLGDFFAQYIDSKSDATYFHVQSTPATVWVVEHNLQKKPTPLIKNQNGKVVITDIEDISENVTHVIFGRPTSGTGQFN